MTAHRLAPFAISEPLPTGTVAIEASAGTGKTYALASLATRSIAEGRIRPAELLVVTFTRAATGELRARVRERMLEAVRFLDRTDRTGKDDDELLRHLDSGIPSALPNLRQAVTEFDAATVTTLHGFATQVRQTLGVAVGMDPDTRLVDDIDETVAEVCADVLAADAVRGTEDGDLPTLDRLVEATKLVVRSADVRLEPRGPSTGAPPAALRVTRLVEEARNVLDTRRRARGTVSFDDVLVQLRDVLRGPGGPAATHSLRQRYRLVLIDEFQDTDQVQWEIFSTLFGAVGGATTLVLVGDPKQSIYRFRGADIGTYLQAVGRPGTVRRSLAVNWRSDGSLLTGLETLLRGVTFGADDIGFEAVEPCPAHRDRRLRTADGADLPPLVLRVAGPGIEQTRTGSQVAVDAAARVIHADLVDHVRTLLDTGTVPPMPAEGDSRPVRPSDIAVLVRTAAESEEVRRALHRGGIPAVVSGSGNVLESPAAGQFRYLLAAMARPSDARIVRAYALSWFVGWSADQVATTADDALVPLQEQLADWAALLVDHAVADVLARVRTETGVVPRVLAAPDGDRNLTDLDHLAELLHGSVPRGMAGVPGLLAVLDATPDIAADADAEVDETVAARRIESEAVAVQIMTVWKAKGLEFPVVCLPGLWRLGKRQRPALVYTEPRTGHRMCDVSNGAPWPDDAAAGQRRGLTDAEEAGERLRLLYVALTRARHQTVVWWANAQGSNRTALAHVLFARRDGRIDADLFAGATVAVPGDSDTVASLQPLVAQAGGTIEVGVVHPDLRTDRWSGTGSSTGQAALGVARFDTVLDRSACRWSFSSMTAEALAHPADPDDPSLSDGGARDEQEDAGGPPAPEGDGDGPADHFRRPTPDHAVGPLARLPAGAAFGTMVHSVLEEVDFTSGSLASDLRAAIEEELAWRDLDLTPPGEGDATPGDGADLLVGGLSLAIDTPLGPLFSGGRLRDLGRGDRMNEVTFDMRLGQGGPAARAGDVGRLVADHLDPGHPLAGWAGALADGSIDVELAGFLTGSIDLVARVPDRGSGVRFVVADYKTNQLTRRGREPHPEDYRPGRLAEAMIEHHYPLQALLYAVALHRYLRWRQPGYRPADHLAGAGYLFVRGMTGPTPDPAAGRPGPAGVFEWPMGPALVTELSDLLDGRRPWSR